MFLCNQEPEYRFSSAAVFRQFCMNMHHIRALDLDLQTMDPLMLGTSRLFTSTGFSLALPATFASSIPKGKK